MSQTVAQPAVRPSVRDTAEAFVHAWEIAARIEKRELEDGTRLGNSDRVMLAAVVIAEALRVARTLDAIPGADPLPDAHSARHNYELRRAAFGLFAKYDRLRINDGICPTNAEMALDVWRLLIDAFNAGAAFGAEPSASCTLVVLDHGGAEVEYPVYVGSDGDAYDHGTPRVVNPDWLRAFDVARKLSAEDRRTRDQEASDDRAQRRAGMAVA